MKQYMLMMSGESKQWKALSPDENQRIMAKYNAFVDGLRKTHGFVGGSPLAEGGFELKATRGAVVVDGPFPETKEVLNGYMIFKAPDFDEALRLARECPALTHGETVQLFELTSH